MSSTFASRLTGSDGRDLRLAFVIQGVPVVFQQGRELVPDAVVALAGFGDGSGHSRYRGVAKIEQAPKELDLQQRRMVGGSLTVDLYDDDAPGGTLLDLFSPRRRREAFLVDDIDAAVDAASLNTVTPFAADDVVYVGGESMIVGAVSGGTDEITDLIRGAFGSEARPHFGAADQGSSVFTTPPSWIGRRVKLIGYFLSEAATTTADLAMVLDTFRLEKAPQFMGEGLWQLQCSHLSDEFARRKLGSGMREVKSSAERRRVNSTTSSFQAADGDRDQFVLGTATTYVRARGTTRGTDVFDGYGWRTVGGGVEVGSVHRLFAQTGSEVIFESPNQVTDTPAVFFPTDLRHIALLPGPVSVGRGMVRALTSRLGDASNGAEDVLPGRDRNGFGETDWRFGAGILAAEVDADAFEDVGNDAAQFSFVIDDEIDLVVLKFAFCVATNSVWLANRDGQLTVRRLSEERRSSSFVVDDDVIIGEPTVEFVEEDIAPRVRLKCNKDTISGELLLTVNLIDSELADRYPDHSDRLEIESDGIVVDDGIVPGTLNGSLRPAMSRASAETLLRTLQKQGDRGRIRITAVCHLDALLLDLGDVVVATVEVPDLEGTTIIERTGRVLMIGPKIDDGEVEVAFELFEPLLAVAPAAVTTGTSGGLDRVVLEASADGTATPARMFAVGWGVEQRSADGQIVNDFIVLAIISDTIVRLDSNPTLTAGDFLVVGEQAFADLSANLNTDDLGTRDFIFAMPTNEADIVDGSTTPGIANTETRWR